VQAPSVVVEADEDRNAVGQLFGVRVRAMLTWGQPPRLSNPAKSDIFYLCPCLLRSSIKSRPNKGCSYVPVIFTGIT